MTISSNDRRKEYAGNGVTTVFTGPRAFSASHIAVYLVDAASIAVLQTGGAYTLTGVGKASTTVTMAVAPPTGKTLLILRTVPLDQDTDITNQGKFLPEIHENAFDKRVMQLQQLADVIARGLFASETDVGGAWNFDAKGRRIINLGDPILPGDAVNYSTLLQQIGGAETLNVDPKYWEFTGDGTTTVFPIPGADITSPVFYDVFVNGVGMEPWDNYTVTISPDPAGSIITLNTPPAVDAAGWVVLRGYAKPLGTDLLTQLLNSVEFQNLLRSLITNTLYETTNVLELGPLRYLIPLDDVEGTAYTVNGTRESYLLRCTNAAATTVTVRANTGNVDLDWETNPVAATFFSVKQHGAGQVTLAADTGVTLVPPAGYLAKTRALGSVISATRDGPSVETWTLSGDLAIDPAYVPGADSYVAMPQVSKSAAYTLQLSDSGKHLLHPSADTTARIWTIPANASVPFPIGAAVTFVNQNGAGAITIAITSDTMRLAGAGTTGSRTLAANGVATALKISATEWVISGTGLT